MGSNYRIIMDNSFTSPSLLQYLKGKGIAATGIVRANRVENDPLKSVKEMEKLERGSTDVVTEKNVNLTFVRWKDNKVVTVTSNIHGQNPLMKAQRYFRSEHKRVDRLDQNASAYMIGLRTKKWWWPIFRYCLDLSANNAYQLYRYQKAGIVIIFRVLLLFIGVLSLVESRRWIVVFIFHLFMTTTCLFRSKFE